MSGDPAVSMTLGQFRRCECIIGGERRRLRPMAANLLFLLLVRAPGGFVSHIDILEWLWPDPDLEPDYAESMISRYVYILRKAGVRLEHQQKSVARGGYRIPASIRA